MEILQLLRKWYDNQGQVDGTVVEFAISGADADKRAAWVTASSEPRMGRLTIWETGEAELELGDVETGKVAQEHRDIADEIGLRDATEALVDWVQGP